MATVQWGWYQDYSSPFVEALLGYNMRWLPGSGPITYYFQAGDIDANGLDDWVEGGAKAAYKAACNAYSLVCNIIFQESATSANTDWIETFGNDTSVGGWHSVGEGSGQYTKNYFTAPVIGPGTWEFQTLLHELGHGLGLMHPHDGVRFPGVGDSGDTGDFGLNQSIFSVMTYVFGYNGVADPAYHGGSAMTPMAFDIAAVQALYGANMSTNLGANDYKLFDSGKYGFYCIWDAGGIDQISVPDTDSSFGAVIDLRAATLKNEVGGGGFVSHRMYGGITIANGVVIENAVGGSGNDQITGNEVANKLTGNKGDDILLGGAGNDTLDGGGGADKMEGGTGDDVYLVDVASDTVLELANGGTDTVRTALSYLLGAGVENLVLLGSGAINGTGNGLANVIAGNDGANSLKGDAGDDRLTGGLGDDLLDGGAGNDLASYGAAMAGIVLNLGQAGVQDLGASGHDTLVSIEDAIGTAFADSLTGSSAANFLDGGAGADTLAGGDGDDIYVIDNAGDTIVEASAAGGVDRVQSAVSFALTATLEHLTLTGLAAINGTGNAAANTLTGNGTANVLKGLGGNDDLDGGAGADSLYGGAGNDIYRIDHGGDKAIEVGAAEGVDSVFSTVGFVLGDFVEHLTLLGSGAINGVGNGLANTITGNAAANVLDGKGGADTLTGGDGNDTYVIDNGGDAIVEASATGGIDRVQSAISFVLATTLEHLTLTGAAVIDATGNDGANILIGNSAANVLKGLGGNDDLDGGGGADTMYGGAGNDIYRVNYAGDKVVEVAAEGSDSVFSTVSFALGQYVENLTLLGTGAINASGNAEVNVLTGNGGANILDGREGADTMTGGGGNDTYAVDNAGDKVVEAGAAGGLDTVKSSVGFVLGETLENLVLTGTAAINGTGNAAANMLTGNGAANVLDGSAGADTMAGGAGNDTYRVDVSGDVVTEAADAGIDTVVSSFSYTLGANLENLKLTGSYTSGTGNALANRIDGGGGTDYLNGLGGADILSGGGGDDYLIVTSAADVVSREAYAGGSGTDRLQIQTYDLVDLTVATIGTDVEQLTAYGTVRMRAGQVDALSYLSAYQVNIATTGTIDLTGATVYVSYFNLLSAGSTLILTGTIGYGSVKGSAGQDVVFLGDGGGSLEGGDGADKLTGGAGSDYLRGGAGGDALRGGAGDDYFIVAAPAEVVSGESYSGGVGTDQIQIQTSDTVDLTVAAIGADVEQLTAYGTVRLRAGQLGVLTYIQAQQVNVATAGTIDLTGATIYISSINLLAAGSTLILTGTAGYASVKGSAGQDFVFGGDMGMTLDGGDGADKLNGGGGSDTLRGGAGADSLNGGDGDDYIQILSATEVASGESYVGGVGSDQLQIQTGETVDLTLATIGADVEQIVAYGTIRLTAAQLSRRGYIQASQVEIATAGTIDLTGAALYVSTITLRAAGSTLILTGTTGYVNVKGSTGADTIFAGNGGAMLEGGDGADRLNGGSGTDYYYGGNGADRFVFDDAPGSIDYLYDFSAAEDLIVLDRSVFTGLSATGPLSSAAFQLGSAAQDASDRILFDQNSGYIYYDSDGTGAAAAVAIAYVPSGTSLSAANFYAVA